MVANDELKTKYGISDLEIAELETSADSYDLGDWPIGSVTVMGRPTLYGERMISVTYRDTANEVERMDARAASLGMTRSNYLRHLVAEDLRLAGAS